MRWSRVKATTRGDSISPNSPSTLGTQHHPQTWEGEDDPGVRVRLDSRGEVRLQQGLREGPERAPPRLHRSADGLLIAVSTGITRVVTGMPFTLYVSGYFLLEEGEQQLVHEFSVTVLDPGEFP